ncbi:MULTISPECIES: glycosyltransferase family 4 protein [Mumia]|uniref:glycosyltransferase family 4 protein n=1 Tax=Mumia TaxID=1546255 RepID=UPI00142197CD|nr:MULTISPECIES: glycosyltransferase family 4 protein [unclassified Mumia]QMW67905.1 glycosyltransferase family 4 protein [Mumia sp. ZJ1417]
MTVVHLVVPDGIDDPHRPSGGNVYDRRLAGALEAGGWSLREHPVRAPLGEVLASIPDGSLVLTDGLVTRGAGAVVGANASRLHVVVLLHEPIGPDGDERAVLASAAAVVTTSQWTADRITNVYGLAPQHLHVAWPGVDESLAHRGTEDGGRLLCVGAVSAAKGQHDLVDALGSLTDLAWGCRMVGSRDVEPPYSRAVMRRSGELGLGGRVTWTGPLRGDRLAAEYASADLLVLPSRAESYGMVVTEALARAVPVVAASVGGVEEALGCTADGAAPGLVVDAANPVALAHALRSWLTDVGLRTWLRRHARARRDTLSTWDATAETVSTVLEGVQRRGAVPS